MTISRTQYIRNICAFQYALGAGYALLGLKNFKYMRYKFRLWNVASDPNHRIDLENSQFISNIYAILKAFPRHIFRWS